MRRHLSSPVTKSAFHLVSLTRKNEHTSVLLTLFALPLQGDTIVGVGGSSPATKQALDGTGQRAMPEGQLCLATALTSLHQQVETIS
ncbi:hypothetical protein Ciccas_002330 [Cichlidogyrus casuarinus]|uniref:Uncharacterized protein n=1 Tax=Cichlidogyrus casuarinus TaxID=1844966 RepID=A0ABD2QHJ9_9PLAT